MLGRLQKVAQNSVDAEKAYKKVLDQDPNNEDALTGLAMVYSDLGDNAQFQQKLAFFAGFARLSKPRCLAAGGRKVAIAQTAASAFAEQETLAMAGKIDDQIAFCPCARLGTLLCRLRSEINFQPASSGVTFPFKSSG